jgi:hypothetical protein
LEKQAGKVIPMSPERRRYFEEQWEKATPVEDVIGPRPPAGDPD